MVEPCTMIFGTGQHRDSACDTCDELCLAFRAEAIGALTLPKALEKTLVVVMRPLILAGFLNVTQFVTVSIPIVVHERLPPGQSSHRFSGEVLNQFSAARLLDRLVELRTKIHPHLAGAFLRP
jgi:hypothetical protein